MNGIPMNGQPSGQNQPNNFGFNQTQQPREILTIDLINGESAMYAYYVAPGVTTFLIDFSNRRFYIKACDPRGVPQQIRVFTFEEFIQNPQPQVVPNQNGSNYVTVDQLDELKAMIQSLATPQQTQPNPNPPRNKQKGGNNQ